MKRLSLLFVCMIFMQFAYSQGVNENVSRDESCPPPENFDGEYYWDDNEFGAHLRWDRAIYDYTLEKFELYRSSDGVNFKMVKRIVNVPNMSHYECRDVVEEPGSFYYKLVSIYMDQCTSEPVEMGIDITGIDEITDSNISIFPNPTSGQVKIIAEKMQKIQIVNPIGQVVYNVDVDGEEISIDMSSFGSGMYIVNVMSENMNFVRKINVR